MKTWTLFMLAGIGATLVVDGLASVPQHTAAHSRKLLQGQCCIQGTPGVKNGAISIPHWSPNGCTEGRYSTGASRGDCASSGDNATPGESSASANSGAQKKTQSGSSGGGTSTIPGGSATGSSGSQNKPQNGPFTPPAPVRHAPPVPTISDPVGQAGNNAAKAVKSSVSGTSSSASNLGGAASATTKSAGDRVVSTVGAPPNNGAVGQLGSRISTAADTSAAGLSSSATKIFGGG